MQCEMWADSCRSGQAQRTKPSGWKGPEVGRSTECDRLSVVEGEAGSRSSVGAVPSPPLGTRGAPGPAAFLPSRSCWPGFLFLSSFVSHLCVWAAGVGSSESSFTGSGEDCPGAQFCSVMAADGVRHF